MDKDDIFIILAYSFLAFVILGLFVLIGVAFNSSSNADNKKRNEYYFETYYDKGSGIKMRIFKDGLGDVLYCEPITTEIEGK